MSIWQSLHLRVLGNNDLTAFQGHATCVSEADKYAKGATKPGGYAAQGYYKDSTGATVAVVAQPTASVSDPADTAFLSARPPWICSVCKVTCTSQDTLLGHAAGVKHRRRVCTAPHHTFERLLIEALHKMLLMSRHKQSHLQLEMPPASQPPHCRVIDVSCH